jgi:Flp pilus assembly pilin Flp
VNALRLVAKQDDGQDMIEYAFILVFIGIAGILALQAIGVGVGTTYTSWMDAETGVPGLWDPPDPSGSGS